MTNTWTMAKVLTRQRFKTAVNTFIVTIVAAVITVILVYLAGSPEVIPTIHLQYAFTLCLIWHHLSVYSAHD